MSDGGHVPVLLEEAVAALAVTPGGSYVDATFGRGGHARAILDRLGPDGRLVAIDRDPAAEPFAARARRARPRFVFRRAWFSELPDVIADLALHKSTAFCSISASPPRRSTTQRAASLFGTTVRSTCGMDPSRGESAAEFLPRATVRELTEVVRDYGEERFAQSIARAVAAARAHGPIERTRQLAQIVGEAVGARTRGDWGQDPATRTFQALRIFVNRELSEVTSGPAAHRIAPRTRRAARGHQLPFARGPYRQAFSRPCLAAVRRRCAHVAPRHSHRRAARRSVGARRPRAEARCGRNRTQSARAQRHPARRATHRGSAAGRLAAWLWRWGGGMTRVNLVLLCALIACALSLVKSRHQARRVFVELERAQAEARGYETEYGQLQLEQSTWGMPARVEKIAREQLRMQLPSAARTEIVALPGTKEGAR
jgi:16S rRNA (cytosine1402-N4)-methyltransferase